MYEKVANNLLRAVKNLKKDFHINDLKKIFDETALLEEKRDFIASTYLTFCQFFGALLTIKNSKFKDQLKTLELFPALNDVEPEGEWSEIWIKIYDSNLKKDRAQTELFKEFLQPDYNPPDDLLKLMAHLQFLHIYFAGIAQSMPFAINSRMDLAMAKLAESARMAIDVIEQSGWDRDRVKSSKDKIASDKLTRKQPVLEEYFRVVTNGMKPHRIATILNERLEKSSGNAPSVDTIKRYLREEKYI